MWYNPKITFSYNRILNMVIGGRSCGKTFNSVKYGIEMFLEKGYQFIYLRRYKKETSTSKNNFFDAIINEGYFSDHKFNVINNIGYVDKKPCVYFFTLSTMKDIKGLNFPNVHLIIFDEFIPQLGVQYLQNEVEAFFDFCLTVNRIRKNSQNCKILMLSNAVTSVNPYFSYFGIRPSKDITKNKFVLVQRLHDSEYIEKINEDNFIKMLRGTKYYEYAVENEFRYDNYDFIEQKTPKAICEANFKICDKMYGFWIDYNNGKAYISKKYDKTLGINFCFILEDTSPNVLLISVFKKSSTFKKLKFSFDNSVLYFEDINTKEDFYKMFYKINL